MTITPVGFNCQNYVRKAFAPKNSANFINNSVSNFTNGAVDTVSFTANFYDYNEPAIKTIEKIKTKGGSVPKRVEELAKQAAQSEDSKDLNLICVHRRAYKGLEDCKTLDEAKEMYPEFKDVKSANEVKINYGSALSYIQNGCVEYFDDGCDISLNILKYYWYDLNSIQDFYWLAHHKYVDARFDYQPTFKKLNIPKFDKHYALAIRAQK